jgi:hypothetical protein
LYVLRKYVNILVLKKKWGRCILHLIGTFMCLIQSNYIPGGGGGYTVLRLSIRPRYFSLHFSQQLSMAEI